MMAFKQTIKTLLNFDFEISAWYRVFVVELAFNIFGIFRVVIFFMEPVNIQPPYWEYFISMFTFILVVFSPIKIWALLTGLATRNSRKLRLYAIINGSVTPLYIPMILYMRWNQWFIQPLNWGTSIEIVILIACVSVISWCIYWAVPRLVMQFDFTSLKRLEKYVLLQPSMGEISLSSPGKVEYERYYRRPTSCTSISDMKRNQSKPDVDKLKNCFISPLNVSIEKDEIIGHGQFGLVYKSCLLQNGERLLIVAKSAKHDDIHSIVHEIAISVYVGEHPNIVHFLGVTSFASEGNYYLLSEYCEGGCLSSYLEKLRPYKSTQYVNINGTEGVRKVKKILIRFSHEILQGMSYLALKRIVHGDLSARNCVLTIDLKIKICDFGLSARLYEYQLYAKQSQQEMLPWRWMPFEALEDLKFSEKSDVYSFGITCWELWTLGLMPYGNITWSIDVLQMLRKGELKLSQPEMADEFSYMFMSMCWEKDMDLRPSFSHLQEVFRSQYDKMILEA